MNKLYTRILFIIVPILIISFILGGLRGMSLPINHQLVGCIIVFILVGNFFYFSYMQDFIRRFLGYFVLWTLCVGGLVTMVWVCVHYTGLPLWWQQAIEVFNRHNVITGLITTVIGLIVIFVTLHPHIRIAKQLVISNDNKLKLQLCNKGIFDLYDVEIELDYCYYNKDNSLKTIKIELNEDNLKILRNRFWSKRYSYYYVRSKNIAGLPPNNDDKWIRCRVSATHGISNVRTTTQKEFFYKDLIKGQYINNKFVKL